MERVLDIQINSFGEGHPILYRMTTNLGFVLFNHGAIAVDYALNEIRLYKFPIGCKGTVRAAQFHHCQTAGSQTHRKIACAANYIVVGVRSCAVARK